MNLPSRLARIPSRLIDELVYPNVPARHRLAVQYFSYTRLMRWEAEVRNIRRYARPGVALDVGANIGLWSYAMAKCGMFSRVIAFEPNPTVIKDLSNAGLPGVSIVQKAVSNVAASALLRIPRTAGQVLTGWASLESRIDVETTQFDEVLVDTLRLDDMNLTGIGLIKIDVEGHELQVLEGARRMLRESRPVCVIECRDRNAVAARQFFEDLSAGYEAIDTQAEYGFAMTAGNSLFATKRG